ncbi:MAG: ribosome silencing factor [Myxococcales bacterium]|nr:ribosome silencing factor [Myxococcales bacterium]
MEECVSNESASQGSSRNLDPATMTVEDVVKYAAQVLWERQARDLKILYVEELVGYTDFLLIASARNERHVEALGNTLERRMRDLGLRSLSREGSKNMRWGVSDYADFVVHVFQIDEREVYDLEGLWHEAPVVEFVPQNQK